MSASLVGSEMCIRDRRVQSHSGPSSRFRTTAPVVERRRCSERQLRFASGRVCIDSLELRTRMDQ
eukprot:506359-Alexandrium_andersonii.AAC.1